MSHQQSHLLLPADSAWLALERPGNPMTITVMLRVEGLTPARFREFLDVYWLAWERFRYMPARKAAAWWWEPDPVFDPKHHLDVVLDRFTREELQDWVSARLNQPLAMYRPRWKFWLAPNAEGGAALLLRIHHCYADGLSLLGIFDRLCPPSPQQHPAVYGAAESSDFSRWTESAQAWLAELVKTPEQPHSPADESGHEGRDAVSFQQLGGVLERLAHSSVRLVHELSEFLVEPADSPSELKRPLLGRRSCRWSPPVPLERFRAIAKATRVTINDVLLSCVAAAVRPRLGFDEAELDDAVLHAAVPVDIRSRLPESLKPEAGDLGNFFGTVFVPLPVDGESSLERLYRIKHETRRLKKSWQPGISWGLASSASLIPETLRQPISDVLYHKASAVVSNVPGTPEPRYLGGCPITEQMFWVPQAGDIGLGISIVSYGGQVQFGVVADEAVLTDPDAFLNDCLSELERFPGGY
ncbi:WS/DGAT domain-containing protein [Marinobacter salinexigens]|uniref:WS/DGAT domain-containing protein n=1 Tax=Marinobacter salinexigens TaxID=2919747 RepID=UPI001FE68AEB|nr:WS/DGAT domain-containing protein [Marinobacter salinexigens]